LRDSTTFEAGKVGLCVRTTKSYQPLSYDGRGNVDLNCARLATFYKPNYDIAEEEWER